MRPRDVYPGHAGDLLLAFTLLALDLAVLAGWELRLWHVRRGVRAGRVPLVTCARCRRRVPDAWPLVNTSKTCAACTRARGERRRDS